ncbi:MAG: HEPN domain-containing protein [Planctomycetota bacterium]|nr:HEPN domain-containing protein [Planctomycetota bacterium]
MPWTLVTPVPQWDVPENWDGCELDPGFRIAPMPSQVRRSLLNALKECEGTGHEAAMEVVNQANTMAMAQIPGIRRDHPNAFVNGLLYQMVADALLRRVFECCRLFQYNDDPGGYWHCCWFLGMWESAAQTFERVKCMHSEWLPDNIPPSTDPDSVDPAEALAKVALNWERLRTLCLINAFVRLYSDPKKQQGFWKAGQARVEREAEQLVRLRSAESSGQEDPVRVKISTRQSAVWQLEGFRDAYRQALDKLEARDYGRGSRLTRAFRLFTDVHSLPLHHRYLSLTMCLETLLGMGKDELTFQLGLRVGWLLYPTQGETRKRFLRMVREYYNFRSKIVHGVPFKMQEVEVNYAFLRGITRMVLEKVISEDRLFSIFSGNKPEACDAYLNELAIGCAATA